MTRLLLVSFIALAGCEAPNVFPGADVRQNTRLARIEGNVVVSSSARGKVVLFLYDAARPPPPTGTGRPLTFTVVARDALFANAADGEVGPFTAPYAFSLRAPGRYLIRAFVDANDDFIPWYGVTADVTAGDVGGGAVDPVTRQPRVIEVGIDEAGNPTSALGVAVSISDSARVPLDRPIFTVSGGQESATLGTTPLVLELQSTPISEGVMQQPAPAFLVRFVDDDRDGVPDDANGDGVPEVWPRVVVRKVRSAEDVLTDENDLDGNGIVDAEGEDYEHVNPANGETIPKDGKPDVVVLAAGFDVGDYAAVLLDDMGRVKQTPTPLTRLKLVVRPRALDASTPASPGVLKLMPIGTYAITVIQETGQTWRVPNELAPAFAEAAGLPIVATQSFVLQVQ